MTSRKIFSGAAAVLAAVSLGAASPQEADHSAHGQPGGATTAPDQQPMGRGMGGMGRGMGRGMGMMGMLGGGDATVQERQDIAQMFHQNALITRSVVNLPNGIRTVTESDDPRMAEVIRRHVREMDERMRQGRDPGLDIESPALRQLFVDHRKIRTRIEWTQKGAMLIQTSDDPSTVAALQTHAAEVSDFAARGMAAAHEAMMKTHGGRGRMMGRHGGR